MSEYYRIKGATLTAIADITRKMAGLSKPLTPSEIVDWLNRVTFVPQGWANSGGVKLFITAAASGRNCSFEHGYATTTLSRSQLNVTTSAIGVLIDKTEE